MLTKTIVAALLATAAFALPTTTARDSVATPDWILSPPLIDDNQRPGDDHVKRDPYSLVHFHIPGAPAPGAEDTVNLDKRFYIYHRPPTPGAETVEKRDDGDIVPDWILSPESIDRPGQPSSRVKRDPGSSVNFWTPEALVDD